MGKRPQGDVPGAAEYEALLKTGASAAGRNECRQIVPGPTGRKDGPEAVVHL